MPLQLKWRLQSVHPFPDQRHHFAVIAVDDNLGAPVSGRARDSDVTAHPVKSNIPNVSKNFPGSFQETAPIVTPFILIIAADKQSKTLSSFCVRSLSGDVRYATRPGVRAATAKGETAR